MRIAIINGPNLNLTGQREQDIYGKISFDQFMTACRDKYANQEISYFQSNSEGAIIDEIHQQGKLADAIIYEEQSHLTPDEVLGREYLFPDFGTGGVGVMQVSGPIGKEFGDYSKTELARDPNKNIDAGIAYIGSFHTDDSMFVGQAYNGSASYGLRIYAQVNDPNYNTNVVIYGLKQIINSLHSLLQ